MSWERTRFQFEIYQHTGSRATAATALADEVPGQLRFCESPWIDFKSGAAADNGKATLGLSDSEVNTSAIKSGQRPFDTFVTHEFLEIAELAAGEI